METISIVKNLLRILTVLYITSSTAFASASSLEGFYAKIDGGAFVVQPITATIDSAKYKIRPKGYSGIIDIGIGCYIKENFRVELAFGHVFDSKVKLRANNLDIIKLTIGKSSKINTSKVNSDLVSKISANVLMLNGYYEIFDVVGTKVFIGGGVGLAKVKESVNGSIAYVEDSEAKRDIEGNIRHNPSFAYSIALGLSKEIVDKAHIELMYSWRDFGWTKKTKLMAKEEIILAQTNQLRGHNISVGFRLDL